MRLELVSNRNYKHFAPTARVVCKLVSIITALCGIVLICAAPLAQTRRQPRTQPQAPRGSAAKYSIFLHASEKHKGLACNACHKIPTAWNANRDFPDVADFPDHNACVGCHRPQFFSGQAISGTGPAICTVCHLHAAPREAARFTFGKPNSANQTAKARDERQFIIEFPHDKHQNVIAGLHPRRSEPALLSVSFAQDDKKKVDYNNCTICHQRNDEL